MNPPRVPRTRRPRPGFTLIEVAVSTLVLGVLIVAALQAAALASVSQYKAGERATGRFLAQGLLADILPLAYQDPGPAPAFGREAGESANSKVNYNDVDDYHGWTESPPQDRDGNALAGLDGWQRSVTVEWVQAANPTQTAGSETGAKRITVTVTHHGAVVATSVAIRTQVP